MSSGEETIFNEALQREDGADREEYLSAACRGDGALRQRVEKLVASQQVLASDGRNSFILDRASDVYAALAMNGCAGTEVVGSVIGSYRLLQLIGEGGMALVFMAEQLHPISRKVALKIIKPGMDSRQVIARFEAERQMLILLDHPSITKVLDAGVTPSGRPYFVMDLVRGASIKDYCETNRVALTERLRLFVETCRGVHHAHQKAIIHRDLKPSNVMVTLIDGRPVPKVIDFGIAKAVDPSLSGGTLLTRYGDLVGTPAYMSPEQAANSGVDVDTRSDVYSLGVLLYELMTGAPPLTPELIRERGIGRMAETIRDHETEVPSQRITHAGEALRDIARNRQVDVPRLRSFLAGELDWIIMKALAKDRTERYEGVADFARDVERYLAGEPVEAAAPSVRYRFRKFAVRHRTTLVSGAVVGATLLLCSILSTILAVRAVNAERLANSRLRDTQNALRETEFQRNRALKAELRAALAARQQKNKAAVSRALNRFHEQQMPAVFREQLAKAVPAVAAHAVEKAEAFGSVDVGSILGLDDLLHASAASGLPHRVESVAVRPAIKTTPASKSTPAIKTVPALPKAVFAERVRSLRPEFLTLVLAEQRAAFGPADTIVADTLDELGRLRMDAGDDASAELSLRESQSIRNDHPDQMIERCQTLLLLAECLLHQSRTSEARRLLDMILKDVPPTHSPRILKELQSLRAKALVLIRPAGKLSAAKNGE